MKASQIMTGPVITVRPDTTILQAARHLVRHKSEALAVVDSQRHLVGVVDEADLFRATLTSVEGTLLTQGGYDASTPVYVGQIMHREVVRVGQDASLERCVDLMRGHSRRCLPVLRGSSLIGMITQRDLLGALTRIGGGPGGDQPLRATAGTGAIDLRAHETTYDLAEAAAPTTAS